MSLLITPSSIAILITYNAFILDDKQWIVLIIMLSCIVLLTLLQHAAALVPVLGLSWAGADWLPLRRDINDFVRDGGPQLDLLLLALEALQARNEDDETGYFQIAGMFIFLWGSTCA